MTTSTCDICGKTMILHQPATRCHNCTQSEAGWRARIAEENTNTLTVVVPEISEDKISNDLYDLTETLANMGAETSAGLLGGEFGYGAYFENETFMMHPYCWCEQESCPWCRGCDCPEEAWEYYVDGALAKWEQYEAAIQHGSGDVEFRKNSDLLCGFCDGTEPAAPNFLHKASGTQVYWYKYIGRGMDIVLSGDWDAIYADCLNSVKGCSNAIAYNGDEVEFRFGGELRRGIVVHTERNLAGGYLDLAAPDDVNGFVSYCVDELTDFRVIRRSGADS